MRGQQDLGLARQNPALKQPMGHTIRLLTACEYVQNILPLD
jgi:hypothetical protein